MHFKIRKALSEGASDGQLLSLTDLTCWSAVAVQAPTTWTVFQGEDDYLVFTLSGPSIPVCRPNLSQYVSPTIVI